MKRAISGDELNSKEEVAEAAVAESLGAGESGSDGSAEGGAGIAKERSAGEVLAFFGECGVDLSEWGAGEGGEGVFGGIVFDNTAESVSRNEGRGSFREWGLGAIAHGENLIMGGDQILEIGDGSGCFDGIIRVR